MPSRAHSASCLLEKHLLMVAQVRQEFLSKGRIVRMSNKAPCEILRLEEIPVAFHRLLYPLPSTQTQWLSYFDRWQSRRTTKSGYYVDSTPLDIFLAYDSV